MVRGAKCYNSAMKAFVTRIARVVKQTTQRNDNKRVELIPIIAVASNDRNK